jgi:hypothetical protein
MQLLQFGAGSVDRLRPGLHSLAMFDLMFRDLEVLDQRGAGGPAADADPDEAEHQLGQHALWQMQ